MAIALAEAEKYEVLERIGNCQCDPFCNRLAADPVSRLWFFWNHPKGQAEERWTGKFSQAIPM